MSIINNVKGQETQKAAKLLQEMLSEHFREDTSALAIFLEAHIRNTHNELELIRMGGILTNPIEMYDLQNETPPCVYLKVNPTNIYIKSGNDAWQKQKRDIFVYANSIIVDGEKDKSEYQTNTVFRRTQFVRVYLGLSAINLMH